jgi:small subunit ribosomal protein S8
MVMNDPLAAVLSHILTCERLGRDEAYVKPASKMVRETLKIMNENLYVGDWQEIKDNKANILKVSLLGKINKCGVIKPRHSVKKGEFEKFEKRYLPARGFGVLIVSTPKGIIPHTDAKDKNTGGKLIAYCY